MNILIVGEWRWEIYEKPFYKEFKELGHNVNKFGWYSYFLINDDKKENSITKLLKKFQNKYTIGSIINKINNDLIKEVNKIKPELIFIYRGTHIFPKTIKEIKKSGAKVLAYNNDDPFGENYPIYYWRHYLNSLKQYDYIFCYRKKNIDDYKKMGFKNIDILRSYYIKERNYPIKKLYKNDYSSDVSFIGHFEEDGRDDYLKLLVDNGINVRIFGDEVSWRKSKWFNFFEERCGKIHQVREDYNLAINSTKIALVFLSKLNNDTYTRRCFEIPAAKVMMLSEETEDLLTLFKKGKEAEYFNTSSELLEKVKYFLQNEKERMIIAQNGYERVLSSGHEINDRAIQLINVFNNI